MLFILTLTWYSFLTWLNFQTDRWLFWYSVYTRLQTEYINIFSEIGYCKLLKYPSHILVDLRNNLYSGQSIPESNSLTGGMSRWIFSCVRTIRRQPVAQQHLKSFYVSLTSSPSANVSFISICDCLWQNSNKKWTIVKIIILFTRVFLWFYCKYREYVGYVQCHYVLIFNIEQNILIDLTFSLVQCCC